MNRTTTVRRHIEAPQFAQPRRARRPLPDSRRRFRFEWERVEQRALLSTITWASDVGGDWDNGSMWTGGAVPGPGDDAVIGFSDITVGHSASVPDTIDSLSCAAELDISGGSLSINPTSASQLNSYVSGNVNLNGGLLQLLAGNLNLSGGGTISASIAGAAGTNLYLHNETLAAGSSVSSAGSVGLTDCTVQGSYSAAGDSTANNTSFTGSVHLGSSLEVGSNVTFAPASGTPATLTVGSLDIGSGTLAGTDNFVVNGLLTVASALETSGIVDAYGGLSFPGTPNTDISGTTLNNHAGATWQLVTGNYNRLLLYNGATINNLPGAIFNITGVSDFGSAIDGGDNSAVAFNNAGTLIASTSGTGGLAIGIPFANSGTVQLQQDTLNLSTASNSGIVTVLSTAALGAGIYTQSAGATILNGGVLNGGMYAINAGTLSGIGTINSSVTSGGQVIPGGTGTAGVLRINGNYTQTTAGSLNIELGGVAAGSNDRLAVSGAATLGGTLNVSTIGGFAPAFDNTFTILTFGSSSGNFSTYSATALANGLFFDPVFQPTNLTLNLDQVAIAGAPCLPLPGVPINLSGPVTGPSAGYPSVFSYAWTVTQNGNPYQSGVGSSFSFMPNLAATYVATLTVSDAAGGKGTTALTVAVPPSIFVLNATANAALSIGGGASVAIPGGVVVDSSAAGALSINGKSQLSASVIDVLGGVKTGTGASISPAPTTGVSIPDPLAALTGPDPSGLNNYGSIGLDKGSLTINPGIYSQIKVSNSAGLTLTPGTYIIEGGGLTVTGSASVSGAGVLIYNTGSNYPSPGGKFSGITVSSTGSVALSAPTSGPYAGVLVFQSRDNTLPLSFGSAMTGMNGTIYAPSALLSLTGSAQLQQGLVVGMLSVNGAITLNGAAAGNGGTSAVPGVANTPPAGSQSVSLNGPAGRLTANGPPRTQDAINAWDAVLALDHVTISAVLDPSPANLTSDTGSARGGSTNGIRKGMPFANGTYDFNRR